VSNYELLGSIMTTADSDMDHDRLDDVTDGCGCAEIWEHLSDRREG